MFGKTLIVIAIMAGVAQGQTRSAPSPTARPSTPRVSAQQTSLDLAEYGVRLEPDARLIIVMSALDAAGFDPTPAGKRLSAFRALVRKDQANLDPDLRERLKTFFERKKLPAPATAAEDRKSTRLNSSHTVISYAVFCL